jgi:hypothetical protein
MRHTFSSWYMMNGGDLYELAQISGQHEYDRVLRWFSLSFLECGGQGRLSSLIRIPLRLSMVGLTVDPRLESAA